MTKAEILDITKCAILCATIRCNTIAAVIQSPIIAESQCLGYTAMNSILVPQMKSFRPVKTARLIRARYSQSLTEHLSVNFCNKRMAVYVIQLNKI